MPDSANMEELGGLTFGIQLPLTTLGHDKLVSLRRRNKKKICLSKHVGAGGL